MLRTCSKAVPNTEITSVFVKTTVSVLIPKNTCQRKPIFCHILRSDDINLKLSNFFCNSSSKVLLSEFHCLSSTSTISWQYKMLLKQEQPFRESSYLINLNQYQNIILTNYSGYPMINVFETHMRYFTRKQFSII